MNQQEIFELIVNCKNLHEVLKRAWEKNLLVSKLPPSNFKNATIRVLKEDFYVINVSEDKIFRIIPIHENFEIKLGQN
jgi:hypothetical protein